MSTSSLPQVFSAKDIVKSNDQSKTNHQPVKRSHKKLPKLYPYLPDKYASNSEKKTAVRVFLEDCTSNGIYTGSQCVQDFVMYIKIGRELFDKEERYRRDCDQQRSSACTASFSTHKDAKDRLAHEKLQKQKQLHQLQQPSASVETTLMSTQIIQEESNDDNRIVPDCWDDEEEDV
jgi:hypothetical protein